MIKTLSPYYFEIPWLSPLTGAQAFYYTLSLYIWEGDIANVPAQPQYSLTKINVAELDTTDKISVSRLINDYLNFAPDTTLGIVAGNNAVWVRKEIVYSTTDPLDDGVVQLQTDDLAIKGYGYGMEGENPQPPLDKVYIQGDEFKANRSSIFSFPVEADGTNITVVSFPNNEINDVYGTTANMSLSGEIIRLLNIDLIQAITDDYVVVTYGLKQIYIGLEDEGKYTPVQIYFMNKEGQQSSVTLFKERRESLTVTKQTYENDFAQPSDGIHQYVDLNVQGRTKLTVSTGYHDESENQTFKELLLSTRVYELNNGVLVPLNVKQSTLDYKTRQNDKMINYEIEFEYSFNDINNI